MSRVDWPLALAVTLCAFARLAHASNWSGVMVTQFGGTYSSDCGDPSAPRLRVDVEGLHVDVAHRSMTGRKVQKSRDPFGNQMPKPGEDIVMLISEVRGGHGLSFWVHRDVSGQYVEIQADATVTSALGKALVAQRFRDCDAARSRRVAADAQADVERAAAPAAAEARPSAGEARFRSAYLRALGPLAQSDAWLVTEVGRPTDATSVAIVGTRYEQKTGCKPHDCGDNNAVVMFSPQTGAVYGQLMVRGVTRTIGEPPPEVSGILERLWRAEWRQGR